MTIYLYLRELYTFVQEYACACIDNNNDNNSIYIAPESKKCIGRRSKSRILRRQYNNSKAKQKQYTINYK